MIVLLLKFTSRKRILGAKLWPLDYGTEGNNKTIKVSRNGRKSDRCCSKTYYSSKLFLQRVFGRVGEICGVGTINGLKEEGE